MRETHSAASQSAICAKWRRSGLTVGFVPTMGALHEGHFSLVKASRRECDRTVVSIFVNPAQFGPGEDLSSYPREPRADRAALRVLGVDSLFSPPPASIYARGFATSVEVGAPATAGMCADFRPGHFRGVATIVAVLFNIVRPRMAYFGMKDAQQAAVVRRMTADLKIGIRIRVLPTVREKDGLAMSSRNRYLSPADRRLAPVLYRSLLAGRAAVSGGEKSAARVKAAVRRTLATARRLRVEYVAVVDPATMEPLRLVKGRALIAVAARIGRARLIDNLAVRAGRR